MGKKLTLQPVAASELVALDGGVSSVVCCGNISAVVRNVVVVSVLWTGSSLL